MKDLQSLDKDFGFFSKGNWKSWRLRNQRNDAIRFVFKSISKAVPWRMGVRSGGRKTTSNALVVIKVRNDNFEDRTWFAD